MSVSTGKKTKYNMDSWKKKYPIVCALKEI